MYIGFNAADDKIQTTFLALSEDCLAHPVVLEFYPDYEIMIQPSAQVPLTEWYDA